MTTSPQTELAQRMYLAFAAGDRRFFEEHLADGFVFSSPPDPHLDRAQWFERCWPGANKGQAFTFARLLEVGREVVVTYELRVPGRPPGRNTEVITFDGDKIVRTEVYFGWNL
jgi:hypothetical protein